jgi:hypothetical protein
MVINGTSVTNTLMYFLLVFWCLSTIVHVFLPFSVFLLNGTKNKRVGKATYFSLKGGGDVGSYSDPSPTMMIP